MQDPADGLETLSLWVVPSEDEKKQWILTLLRHGTTLDLMAYRLSDLTEVELDSLVGEVTGELEEQVAWAPCEPDPVREGICVRPAKPSRLYLMDRNDAPGEPGMAVYDLAARHGVRALQVNLRKNEPSTGRWVVGTVFESLLYPDHRAYHRGDFPLRLTNGPQGSRLALSVFDSGEMPPDALDALVEDAKATFEAHYGSRFCRADPATERCDAARTDLERQREAWLGVRATRDPWTIETFLEEHPNGHHAEDARQRLARLRTLAKRPAPAPAAPAAPWVGRRPTERFADVLPDGSSGPEMTVVPAGVFLMGCASSSGCPLRELPVHAVRVGRPFALSTREVTHAEYFRFARPDKRLDPSWRDRPMTHLNWVEAAAYAAWLSKRTGAEYRLPSEAEWEWAARAGTTTPYPWGDEMEGGRARCHECPWPQPTGLDVLGTPRRPVWVWTVGAYPANPWGFHDMHGNAAEWTADCWHADHLGAPADGSERTDGDCSRRVVRGGSYDTPPAALRSSARLGKAAGERYLDVGFRVLRELRNVETWSE